MEEDLKTLVWNRLPPGEDPKTRMVDETCVRLFYRQGIVDNRRVTWENWQRAFKGFRMVEGNYVLDGKNFQKIGILFYGGTIKKPFSPHRLSDGSRPMNWLQDLYQKVLRHETSLKLEEWNQIIKEQFTETFVSRHKFQLNSQSKDLILKIIEERPSPLRRLEKWVFESEETEQSKISSAQPSPVSAPPSSGLEDRYEATPEEIRKKAAIEQLYYSHSKTPTLNDDETLGILDEITDLEDDEDEGP